MYSFSIIIFADWISFLLFISGFIGILENRKHLLIMLVLVEFILASIVIEFVMYSIIFDDILGQCISLIILVIGGSEVALGLSFLIYLYRSRNDISTSKLNHLKSETILKCI